MKKDRADVIAKLQEWADPDSEPSSTHVAADDLIIEFLRSEGYGDVADAYEDCREKVDFWYS